MTHNRLHDYDAPPAPASILRRVARLSGVLVVGLGVMYVAIFIVGRALRAGWGPN